MTEQRLRELRLRAYTFFDLHLREACGEIEQLKAESESLRKELDQYRWRPISEIHEDLGPCVLIRLDDPGYMEIGSNLDEDFNEPGWTHFAEVPKLTIKEAQALEAKP